MCLLLCQVSCFGQSGNNEFVNRLMLCSVVFVVCLLYSQVSCFVAFVMRLLLYCQVSSNVLVVCLLLCQVSC